MPKRHLVYISTLCLCLAGCGDENKDPQDEGQGIIVDTCDASQNTCFSQYEVSHCVNGVRELEHCPANTLCYDGHCGERICEPNVIDSCEANGKYYGCNPLGTGKGSFDCGYGLTCVDDACVPRICEAGSGKCLDDDTILLCNEAGTAYDVEKKCMDILSKSVCEEGSCIPICDKTTKEASYIGCEYWAVDLDNALDAGYYDAAGQPFAVVLSNTHDSLNADVSIMTREENSVRTVLSFSIKPHSVVIAYLPDGCYDGGQSCAEASAVNGTLITPSAYHIKSDLPITAAQFNPLNNVQVFSNDASLLFPTTAIGKRYMVMAREQHYKLFSAFVTVVATEPGQTVVQFTSSCAMLAGYDKKGGQIPAMSKGQTQTFVLDQYDVLNLETSLYGEDPTGSMVVADKNVAVFAGNEATSIPETEPVTCCADHIEHQQYPLGAWGRTYNAAKLKPRNKERDMWRILARINGTRVTTTPNVFGNSIMLPDGSVKEIINGVLELDAGQWIDILTAESFNISASHPILVGQFMTGQDDPMDPVTNKPAQDETGNLSAGIGDPAYLIGVPVEQYRKQYAFLAPAYYEEDYVSIVAPIGTTVVLDGRTIDQSEFTPFGDGKFAVSYQLIEDGSHELTASNPVGLFSYGIDQYVSYAYPAGLDLRELFSE